MFHKVRECNLKHIQFTTDVKNVIEQCSRGDATFKAKNISVQSVRRCFKPYVDACDLGILKDSFYFLMLKKNCNNNILTFYCKLCALLFSFQM